MTAPSFLKEGGQSPPAFCTVLVGQQAKNGLDFLDDTYRAGAAVCAVFEGIQQKFNFDAKKSTIVLQLIPAANADEGLETVEDSDSDEDSVILGPETPPGVVPPPVELGSPPLGPTTPPIDDPPVQVIPPRPPSPPRPPPPPPPPTGGQLPPPGDGPPPPPPTPGGTPHCRPTVCPDCPGVPTGQEGVIGVRISKAWLQYCLNLIALEGTKVAAIVPLTPMAKAVLHDDVDADAEYTAKEYLDGHCELEPDPVLYRSNGIAPKLYPGPYPVGTVSINHHHTSGLVAAGEAVSAALSDQTTGQRMGLVPTLGNAKMAEALVRGIYMNSASYSLARSILSGVRECAVHGGGGGASGGGGTSSAALAFSSPTEEVVPSPSPPLSSAFPFASSATALCDKIFEAVHTCLKIKAAAEHRSRSNSIQTRAIIVGGEPNRVAAALFRDGHDGHGVVYITGAAKTAASKLSRIWGVFNASSQARVRLYRSIIHEALDKICDSVWLTSRTKDKIKARKAEPVVDSEIQDLPLGKRAASGSTLVVMGDGSKKRLDQVKRGDYLAQPNSKPVLVTDNLKFLADASDLVHIRVASPLGTPTDDEGNKCSDFFRDTVGVTKTVRFLASLQSTLSHLVPFHAGLVWKEIDEVLVPERNVRAAMASLPADADKKLKQATNRAETRNQRSYPCLVTPGSFLGEDEARKQLLDHVKTAWKAAGCSLPANEKDVEALLLDICSFILIWLGDGTCGSSSVTLGKIDLPRMQAIFTKLAGHLKKGGGDFKVNTHQRINADKDCRIVSCKFFLYIILYNAKLKLTFLFFFLSFFQVKLTSASGKIDPLAKLMELLGANEVNDGGHRHVPSSLYTLLLSLASKYRIACLSGIVITDGSKRTREMVYIITQGLLMSILGKYRYQTHLSIIELAADLSVFEGLGGPLSWLNHRGYGAVVTKCSGLLCDRLCKAVGNLMPRKGFEQSFLRSPGLANCVRVEEVPAAQVPSGEKVLVCVPMTASGPVKLVFSNWMCVDNGLEPDAADPRELISWAEHIPDAWYQPAGLSGSGTIEQFLAKLNCTAVEFASRPEYTRQRATLRYLIEGGYVKSTSRLISVHEQGILPLMERIGTFLDAKKKEREHYVSFNFLGIVDRLSAMRVAPVPLADGRWVDALPHVRKLVESWLKGKFPLWEPIMLKTKRRGCTRFPVQVSTLVRKALFLLSALIGVGPIRATAILLNAVRAVLPQSTPAEITELNNVEAALARVVHLPRFDFPKSAEWTWKRQEMLKPLYSDHEAAVKELKQKAPSAPQGDALVGLTKKDVMEKKVGLIIGLYLLSLYLQYEY